MEMLIVGVVLVAGASASPHGFWTAMAGFAGGFMIGCYFKGRQSEN